MPVDPSVTALPAGSLFSFGIPCLKWKLAAAFKTHWGFDGFDTSISPPHKYLTISFVYTVINNIEGQDSTTVQYGSYTLDRFSGNPSGSGVYPADWAPSNWMVTYHGDTQVTADTGTVTLAPFVTQRQIWQTTLSNPYKTQMLEADCDALLDSFDPSTVANNTFTSLYYPTDVPGGNNGLLQAASAIDLVPGGYGLTEPSGEPGAAPTLGPIALAAYLPGLEAFENVFGISYPAGFVKMVGYLGLAGNYCLKTYTVDPSGNPIGSPTCLSGSGSCSTLNKVSPPTPFVIGQNTYVVAIPNCQCAS